MKGQEKLPETYKGYQSDYLLNILEEMKTETGTKVPLEARKVLDEMLQEYKLGCYSYWSDTNDIIHW